MKRAYSTPIVHFNRIKVRDPIAARCWAWSRSQQTIPPLYWNHNTTTEPGYYYVKVYKDAEVTDADLTGCTLTKVAFTYMGDGTNYFSNGTYSLGAYSELLGWQAVSFMTKQGSNAQSYGDIAATTYTTGGSQDGDAL